MSEQLNKENVGWIYCMTNPCMPGLVKVGMTKSQKRLPSIRANELFTTGVPMPFEVIIEKLVYNPASKENSLHNILSKYSERVNIGREFFRVSIDVLRDFFDLIEEYKPPGDLSVKENQNAEEEKDNGEKNDTEECWDKTGFFGNKAILDSLDDDIHAFWNKYPKQKQQLLDWKAEYTKKAENPNIPKSQHLPSTTAESGSSELKAANLRQRIRARQATPPCWPHDYDDEETVIMKENMIAMIVGGRWFDRN